MLSGTVWEIYTVAEHHFSYYDHDNFYKGTLATDHYHRYAAKRLVVTPCESGPGFAAIYTLMFLFLKIIVAVDSSACHYGTLLASLF